MTAIVPILLRTWLIGCWTVLVTNVCLASDIGQPHLWRRIETPEMLCAEGRFAGDLRIGDVDGDGQIECVVYRSTDSGMKPCFIGAFDLDGRELWRHGRDGDQPQRPGPVAVYDFNGDRTDEIVCFFADPCTPAPIHSMANVVTQLRDGRTGEILREKAVPAIRKCSGEGPNWVHHRLLIANLRGRSRAGDFVVKLGTRLLALTDDFDLLWSYDIPWNEYGRCSAYIPAVGDIDGDGKDEINGGYYLLDDDGEVLWAKRLGPNMDSVTIAPWDEGRMRAICSGAGHVMDARGRVILSLGEQLVPHGQEVRVADFDSTSPGPEMIIRYNGHNPQVMVVGVSGRILRPFTLNDSPNHTGMEAVHWYGAKGPALLYNGGILWTGQGQIFARLVELPKPVGPEKMGWYHCIAADVCGDRREELILYNPWDRFVWIYTPRPLNAKCFRGYVPGPRQYNVRLMD